MLAKDFKELATEGAMYLDKQRQGFYSVANVV